MIQIELSSGKQTKFPPGVEINFLGAITFTETPSGYEAVFDFGHESGETLSIPAVALDSYVAARKAFLLRHAARLILDECDNCRTANEARAEWVLLLDQAIARGRA